MELSELKPGDYVYELSPIPPTKVAHRISFIKDGKIHLEDTDIRTYEMNGDGGYEGMKIIPAPDYPRS